MIRYVNVFVCEEGFWVVVFGYYSWSDLELILEVRVWYVWYLGIEEVFFYMLGFCLYVIKIIMRVFMY